MTSFDLRIVFIGSVDFSEKSFSSLISKGFNLVGLVTKKSSKFNSDHRDLSLIAKNNNIPFIYREKFNEVEIINFIKKVNGNIIYCFGWSHILSSSIINFSCKI